MLSSLKVQLVTGNHAFKLVVMAEHYDASNNNCQVFIKKVLSASGLYNSSVDKFVMQDAESLIKSLHPIAKKVVDTVTDVADRADALVKGSGDKRRKCKK